MAIPARTAHPGTRGFTDRRIRDEEDFHIRRTYIHQNPVQARLVEVEEAYPFSSARRVLKKAYPSG
jgi:hypothetical protein